MMKIQLQKAVAKETIYNRVRGCFKEYSKKQIFSDLLNSGVDVITLSMANDADLLQTMAKLRNQK